MYFIAENMNSKVLPGEETVEPEPGPQLAGEWTYITMWKLLLEFYIHSRRV